MDPRFDEIFSRPENDIFNVIFFPDRVYHAAYFNATTSDRYRYYVAEVRDKLDITALTGSVYLDGRILGGVLRIEYKASRLVEQARERERWPGSRVAAKVLVTWEETGSSGKRVTRESGVRVLLHFCPWVDAYQVELWSALEPPARISHHPSVTAQMGARGPITADHRISPALAGDAKIKRVRLAFEEDSVEEPLGELLPNPQTDNFYDRTIQVPRNATPNSNENTVEVGVYDLDFRRAWILESEGTMPVLYNNGLIEESAEGKNNPDHRAHNIIAMRWILQQELGASLVYFHEVIIPPGSIEGTHQHIGSEELYYIVEGTGVAYLGLNDDPECAHLPVVESFVFGFGPRKLREVPVKPGTVIFTKSGGIHGIRNPNLVPLKFVAFGYHTR